MALVRFGSCGAVRPNIAVGTICVCEQGCTLITQNPDAYGHDAPEGELKFSSQGRLDDNFGDGNSEVVQAAMKQFPTLGTLEVSLVHRTDGKRSTALTTGTITVSSVTVKLEFHCNLSNACMTE
eukprot:21509-Heterococcus_DN1.PRE.4